MRGAALIIMLLSAQLLSGCGKMLGNLRRDLDDSPAYEPQTVGGTWTERGFLAEGSDYTAVGHSERSPASAENGGTVARRQSWVNARNDAGRRQATTMANESGYESGEVAYSNTPMLPPPVRRAYKNGDRATRQDFIDDSQDEGSLWASDGQTNYYFSKNKIRGLGDILTVTLDEDLVRDTATEITRALTPKEREAELALAQERLRLKALGLDESEEEQKGPGGRRPATSGPPRTAIGANSTGTVVEEGVIVPKATYADIDVKKSLELKEGDTMMAEIIERFPNGNFKIRGTKKLRYRNGYRLVSMLGIIRGKDVTEEDTIESRKIYEYRLEVLR